MHIDLRGKRAVVAGGSKGIGRSIALGLTAAGVAASICARGGAALDNPPVVRAAEGLAANPGDEDLACQAPMTAYLAASAEALGGLDMLVNNASGLGMGDDEEAWAKSHDIDVMAMVRATHAAI